jgi:hypothetical protein
MDREGTKANVVQTHSAQAACHQMPAFMDHSTHEPAKQEHREIHVATQRPKKDTQAHHETQQ